MMKIGHIELFVADTIKSLRFYRDILGFTVEMVQNDTFVWMKSGDITLLLRPGHNKVDRTEYKSYPQGIVLYTDNLDEMREKLSNRGLTFQGTDGSPGCLTFTDPDGHWFQLVDPNEH
jgi:catechol 2,3-dioxygenase-like lactoylglutathione lyase family enzyme